MRSGKWDTVGGSLAIAGTIAFVLGMLWMVPAFAADKGGPNVDQLLDPIKATKSNPWTGCYVGLVGEYAKQSTEFGVATFSASDLGGGVAVGCDVRLPNTSLVMGVMGDYVVQRGDGLVADMDSTWSVLARAGVLFSPTTLFYVGAGHTQVDGSFVIPSLDNGLTLAAGMETFVTKNLSLRAEYRHIDLGDAGGGFFTSSMDAARLGLNWRF